MLGKGLEVKRMAEAVDYIINAVLHLGQKLLIQRQL
jgi:hypothetical protein